MIKDIKEAFEKTKIAGLIAAGALDEINVEACGRLLKSLKKWFKSILVISHIDAVKDNVDHIIEINKNGKDSKIVEKN